VQNVASEERVRSSRNVVSRVVAEEALVVPIRGGAGDLDSIYTFNDSGTRLWGMLEEGRSATELAEYLQASYGITAEQARMDAVNFLAELNEEGLTEQA
jgi:hypothetical protein